MATGLRRARGALAVWFAATLGACALAAYAVVDHGLLNAQRQHLDVTVDAAAFSGAAAEARALNFTAYANRTVVANEVFVAQLVSVDSWVRYVDKLAANLAMVTGWIPYLGQVMVQISQVMDQIREVVGLAAQTGVAATSTLDHTLAAAVEAAWLSTPLAADEAARATLSATPFRSAGGATLAARAHPAVAAEVAAINATSFLALARRYSGDERGRIQQVVLDSRDGFTLRRPGSALTNLDLFLFRSQKTSGATVMEGYDRWVGQDTLDMGLRKGLFGKWGWSPVAWGRASATEEGERGDYWCGPNSRPQVSCAGSRFSWTWAWQTTDQLTGYRGLPALRDIARTDEPSPTARFVFAATLEGSGTTAFAGSTHVTRTGAVGPAGATHPLAHRLLHDRLQAVAQARIAFVRPQALGDAGAASWRRADGAVEYASLFNPYWQARLAPLSVGDRLALMLPMGVPAVHALAER